MNINKRVYIGIGVAVLIGGGIAVFMMNRLATPVPSLSSGMTYANAKRLPVTASCLVADDSLTISASQRNNIEQTAMSHLYDVPAGTNVDVLIASLSDDMMTGSDRYAGDFGSYNFSLKKVTNGDWHFTSFERCR